jgi:hypothetical protein
MDNATKTKLTLVTVNGRTIMAEVPVDDNGKVKVDLNAVTASLGIPAGSCIWVGIPSTGRHL